MDLKIPKDEIEFFKHIWRIIGIREIKQDDLIYNLSFKMNFPDSPLKMANKVKNALKQGILVKNDNKICLADKLIDELKNENRNIIDNIQTIFPRSIDSSRIEDNIDTWKYEEYSQTSSSKPKSKFLQLLKMVFTKDEIARGNRVESDNVEIKKINENLLVFEANVQGSSNNTYKILIDAANKVIFHDCEDFIRNRVRNKEFCKHFYRPILNLRKINEDFGEKLLNELKDGRDGWAFQIP